MITKQPEPEEREPTLIERIDEMTNEMVGLARCVAGEKSYPGVEARLEDAIRLGKLAEEIKTLREASRIMTGRLAQDNRKRREEQKR